jgi:hypothetical protein
MFPKGLACGGPLSNVNQEAALSQWGEHPNPDAGHSMDKSGCFRFPTEIFIRGFVSGRSRRDPGKEDCLTQVKA